ncbi:MAG: tetratricopeptide repeat protein [Leptolyngbya sp. SIO1D8]|nr:tetratricopeptide repeat protein [Leptolyngbya sp. SIO1D8]
MLVVAIGAFLTISLLPLLAGRSNHSTVPTPAQQASGNADVQSELEARAQGYEAVLEREPDNQTAIQGLVEARIQLGDLEGVVEPLEKLASLNPNVPEYQILLGQTKQALGDIEGAAQAYRTVLTSAPGNMQALQGLAALLLEQDRPQAAIGLLQDTLKTAPQTNEITPGAIDVASVQLLLAQVYVENQQVDEALRIYDDAIDAASDDFRPLLAKALVLRDIDQVAEAALLFEQAEEMAPAQYKDQVRALAAGGGEAEAIAPATEDGSSPIDTEATPDSESSSESEASDASEDDDFVE